MKFLLGDCNRHTGASLTNLTSIEKHSANHGTVSTQQELQGILPYIVGIVQLGARRNYKATTNIQAKHQQRNTVLDGSSCTRGEIHTYLSQKVNHCYRCRPSTKTLPVFELRIQKSWEENKQSQQAGFCSCQRKQTQMHISYCAKGYKSTKEKESTLLYTEPEMDHERSQVPETFTHQHLTRENHRHPYIIKHKMSTTQGSKNSAQQKCQKRDPFTSSWKTFKTLMKNTVSSQTKMIQVRRHHRIMNHSPRLNCTKRNILPKKE